MLYGFEEVFEPPQDCPMLRDKEVIIDEYIRNTNKIIYFNYGDNWIHEIFVQHFVNTSTKVKWQGEIVSIQPRTRAWRYLTDNRPHYHLGYNFFIAASSSDGKKQFTGKGQSTVKEITSSGLLNFCGTNCTINILDKLSFTNRIL